MIARSWPGSLALVTLLVLLVQQNIAAVEFPYAVNVGELHCDAMVERYSCTHEVETPEIVARTTVYGCGYFKGEQGPVNNRWFDQCDPALVGGYAKVCVYGRDNRLGCGLVDTAINVVIPLVYNELRFVQEVDVVAVNYLEKWGYFSLRQRRLLFTPQFSYVSDFGDGLAYVIDANEEVTEPAWIINDSGLRVAPVDQKIEVKGRFGNEMIPARLGNKWGYIGAKGTWIIPPQFHSVGSFVRGVAPVRYEQEPAQWALINTGGEGLLFFEGDSHRLQLGADSTARLAVGCPLEEKEQPAASGSDGIENPPLPAPETDKSQDCFQLCFNIETEAIDQRCLPNQKLASGK